MKDPVPRLTEPAGPLLVSEAAPGELATIAALDEEAFGDAWGLDYFQQELLRDDRWLGSARDGDGVTCGFADCWIVHDELQLQRIATAATYRRRGVGVALLAALLAFARARSLRVVTLEVRCDNEAAIALYRRFGFVEVGRRPRYYGPIDAVLLDRVL